METELNKGITSGLVQEEVDFTAAKGKYSRHQGL